MTDRFEFGPREPGALAECWGWELREPTPPSPTPFDEPPPHPMISRPRWSRPRTGTSARGWTRTGEYVLAAAVAVAVAVVGAGVLRSYSATRPAAGWITFGFAVAAVLLAGVAAQPVLTPAYSDWRYRRWRRRSLRAHRGVAAESQRWAARRAEHEQTAAGADAAWVALRPVTTHRVDIYGGDPDGGSTLLAGIVTSLLDTGSRITVVELSQDDLAGRLARAVPGATTTLIPDQLAVSALLTGLSAADIGVILTESLHAMDTGKSAADDRTLDADLVEKVGNCLDGQLTFTRLAAALRLATEQASATGDVLAPAEQMALTNLFGEGTLRAAESRLYRLAAAAQRLAAVEDSPVPASTDEQTDPALRIWQLSDRVDDLTGTLLAQVVFHATLHRVRGSQNADPPRVLVLTGCDRLRRTHLERLDQLARRRGIRLLFFFRHLREDAVELLGGSEAVLFMRLGNAKEAENAASFIGKQHRVVASGFTVSRSASWSTTTGTSTSVADSEQESTSSGTQWGVNRNYHFGALFDFPHESGGRSRGGQSSTNTGWSVSTTEGTSTSQQYGGSTSESLAYQRVYEYSVEPSLLQRLSSTAFVLVDPRDQGSPRLGDCDPQLRQSAAPYSFTPAVAHDGIHAGIQAAVPGPAAAIDAGVHFPGLNGIPPADAEPAGERRHDGPQIAPNRRPAGE